MRYPVSAAGFSFNQVELETGGWFSGPRLLQNGEPVPKGPKRGTLTLRRDDGSDAVARLRMTSAFGIDPVPTIEIDGTRFQVVKPFTWYETVWLGLPILLILQGGAIGAGVGVAATMVNARAFRSDRPAAVRYAMTAGISILAVIAWLLISVIVLRAMGR